MPRLLLFLPLFLTACIEPGPPPAAPDPAADSVFALLGRLDTTAVPSAFARLQRMQHAVETVFEVYDETGAVVGRASRTVRYTPTHDGIAARVLAADSTGALPPGGLDDRVANPFPGVLPAEPAFLAARTREHYRYTMAPDTVVDGRRLRVAEARLRPEAGAGEAVRYVRYLLAPDRDAVAGLTVERGLTSVLFDESSRASVRLASVHGALLPVHVETEATVDTPGAPLRRYRLTQRITADPDRTASE